MSTPPQAHAAADALVKLERQKALDRRNAEARPVPWFYRVPELEGLEPWERSKRVAEARQAAAQHWLTALSMVAFAALVGGLMWVVGVRDAKQFPLFVLFGIAPMHFIQVFFVRRRLRR
jgi:hypothetical protein